MLMPQSPFMCMPGMPGMPQMFPQMQPPAQPPQEGDTSSQSSESSESEGRRKRARCGGKNDKSSKAQISHAGGLVMEVPKVRKSEALEEVCDAFDATSTADLSMGSMDKLLWLVTHVRPNTKLADLRCVAWRDLFRKLQQARKRVEKGMTEVKFKNMMQELEPLNEETIAKVAAEHGFEDCPIRVLHRVCNWVSPETPDNVGIGFEDCPFRLLHRVCNWTHRYRGLSFWRAAPGV